MQLCIDRHSGEKLSFVYFDGDLEHLESNMDERMRMDTLRLASGSNYEGTNKGYLEFQYRDNEYMYVDGSVMVIAGQYILRNIKGDYFVVSEDVFKYRYSIEKESSDEHDKHTEPKSD